MHRGTTVRARGVKLITRKFGAYPPSVDALVQDPTTFASMRKKYTDPTTGKEDGAGEVWPETRLRRPWAFLWMPLRRLDD